MEIITVWETGEVHTGYWWGNLRERNHLEDLGVDGKIILKCSFQKLEGVWTVVIWFWIGTGCGLL